MTADRTDASDRQLADIVEYLARVCLETERGLRPAGQLTRFMDPAAALRFRAQLTLGRFDGGPIQPGDIGTAHLTRHRHGTVLATVVTATEGRHWGALSFKLEEHQGRWQIIDIRRLLARSRTRPGQARTIDQPAAVMSRPRPR